MALPCLPDHLAPRHGFNRIEFGQAHELRIDKAIVIGLADVGKHFHGFNVGAARRQQIPYGVGLPLDPFSHEPQQTINHLCARDLPPRSEQGQRRHARTPTPLISLSVHDERRDGLEIAIADRGQDTAAVLRDDVAGDVERSLLRQTQPSDDVRIGPCFTPLCQQIQCVRENRSLLPRCALWIANPVFQRLEQPLAENLALRIRRRQRPLDAVRRVFGQRSERIVRRHGRNRLRDRLVREPVDACPEWTARTGASHGVVDAFLVRTADDAVRLRGSLDLMRRDERGRVCLDDLVRPDVPCLRRPRPHDPRVPIFRMVEDRNDQLRGAGIVRSVDGDGRQGEVIGGAPTRVPGHRADGISVARGRSMTTRSRKSFRIASHTQPLWLLRLARRHVFGSARASRRDSNENRSGHANRNRLDRVIAVPQSVPLGTLGLSTTDQIGRSRPEDEIT